MNQNKRFLRELRCTSCHKLLLKEYIFNGHIEIKCPACKSVNFHRFSYYKNIKSKDAIIVLRQRATDSDAHNMKVEKG